ncbi:vWA domain-containing protein [Desulfonatronum thioautotrophicum]|uniref:vWA domain-containing protein n=1 Tax=Desulfonatronum thioautotrophicum TaxID=617001 RepID=UPI0005EBB60A|nr:vWA domain-containing protein [Desulfonatronum thioautotrophicum]
MKYQLSTVEQRPKGRLRGLLGIMLAAAMLLLFAQGSALAAPSLTWNSPPDGTVYNVGTLVAPTGTAAGFETGGVGLDLALVLDASGSMTLLATAGGVTKRRWEWQADAAVALVNSLPADSTAVAIIQYGTVDGSEVVLSLTPTTQAATIVAAIQGIITNQSQTAIGQGIILAQGELTGSNHTPGRSQQMVVISDGFNTTGPNPVGAAANAAAAGITVHGVVIPGGGAAQMQSIANNGGGTFIDLSEGGLENIEELFTQGGTFVGLEQLDITLPDGTLLTDYPTDAFGNFIINPAWSMLEGDNTFTATATFLDDSSLTRQLNLIGRQQQDPGVIPEPATVGLLALGLGLVGLHQYRRRKN